MFSYAREENPVNAGSREQRKTKKTKSNFRIFSSHYAFQIWKKAKVLSSFIQCFEMSKMLFLITPPLFILMVLRCISHFTPFKSLNYHFPIII